jgi:UDP-N-acetylmuramate dehydrogenase
MKSTDKAPAADKPTRAELVEAFGSGLEFNKPLAPCTSFRTGGPAACFLAVNDAETIARAVREAQRLGISFALIGGGSNLLVSDGGFDGLVIKVDVRGLEVLEGHVVISGAGEDLMGLVRFAQENNLAGLEFAAGIWGTVGGAIYGNAGAFGGEIGDLIIDVTLVDRAGTVRTVDRDYCRFQYRDSYLKKTREIVAEARLQLQPGDRDAIRKRVEEILALRVTKHPEQLTAGCVFKNIPDRTQPYGKLPAGKLLEEVGAKQMAVGGAKVFERHANIIVNSGNATSADIFALLTMMKEKVRERFGIELEEEVIRIGEFK